MKINIACGDSYTTGWSNYDYSPHSSSVRRADLLDKLPIADASAELVYLSHFIEHIPRNYVSTFLAECFRITKSGGCFRLVLPDLQEMCAAYLDARKNGDNEHAEFLVLEILDQCVRSEPGGYLGAYYERLQQAPDSNRDLIDYVRHRTGHHIESASREATVNSMHRILKIPDAIRRNLEQLYCRTVLAFLPTAFRRHNVSLTTIGEKHAWIYDFYSIQKLLIEAGFTGVQRKACNTSNIEGFPFYPLDLTKDGQARKGAESMYIEAFKP